MGLSALDYREQLQALLPPGGAWTRQPDAVLTRVLDAIAQEMARLDARAQILIDESDPRSTAELLADWERVAALPEPCLADIAQTSSERRAALHTKLTRLGGLSRAFFIAFAAAAGYTVTITEARPFQAGHSVAGHAITNGVWVFTWQVNSALHTVRVFGAGSGAAGDALRSWGNALLECLCTRYKPAHTLPIFAYA